jgi:hypothetical protein
MARKPKAAKPAAQAKAPEAPVTPLDKRWEPHRLLPVGMYTSTDAAMVETAKLNEIMGLLWLPARLSKAERDAQLVKAIDLLESIKPADGIEMMLAEQMVGTHTAAMECLRRAMLESQTFEGRNASLSHAQRLMALYTKQLAALDKHRGKGQQRVTVEHVHVAPGGQAIVGNVETRSTGPVPGRSGQGEGVPSGAYQSGALPPPDTGVPLPIFSKSETKVRQP